MGHSSINIVNNIEACLLSTPTQFLTTVADAADLTPLKAASTPFRKATVLAVKTLSGTVNAGVVKLGPSGTADQQPIILNPADEVTLEAPSGAKYDFASWYIKVATNGDGVVVIYS